MFTATVDAALETGAIPYATGLVRYQLEHYIRDDGMVHFHATELPAMARMLTTLANFFDVTGDADGLLLGHFGRISASAELLLDRRAASLVFPVGDPRRGIPAGSDALDEYTPALRNHDVSPKHWFAAAAEAHRAFSELGRVWRVIGAAAHRADIEAHGVRLQAAAPGLLNDLRTALKLTVTTGGDGRRCWHPAAESGTLPSFRAFSEMLHSGVGPPLLLVPEPFSPYRSAQGSPRGDHCV